MFQERDSGSVLTLNHTACPALTRGGGHTHAWARALYGNAESCTPKSEDDDASRGQQSSP